MTGATAGLTGTCLKPVDHAIRVIKVSVSRRAPVPSFSSMEARSWARLRTALAMSSNLPTGSAKLMRACQGLASQAEYRSGPIAESLIQTIGDVAQNDL